MARPNGRSKKNNPQGKKVNSDKSNLAKVYSHSKIGVLIVNTEGAITHFNPAAVINAGLDKQDLTGQSFFSIFTDPSPDRLNEPRLRGLAEITDQEFMVAAGRPKDRWVLISSEVPDSSSDGEETILFVRDITKIKKREKLFAYLNHAATELAKARDTQVALDKIAGFIVPAFANWFTIDRLNDGRLEQVLVKHEDPGKIEWAREYRKNYPPDPNGNTGAAVVLKTGKPGFVPVVTDEMLAAVCPDPVQLKAVRQIGMQSLIVMPLFSKEVASGVVNFISSNPDRHFDGIDLEFAQNFANLMGLALENTRLNEEAQNEIGKRKQSEEQFRFLTDAVPHKIWTSAPDGRATYYNQQWYDYTGITGFEALREQIWNMIHPDDRAIAEVEWPKAIKSGEGIEMEHRFRRHDGVYRWHLSRFVSHKNEDGQVISWVGTSTDIHEQKESRLEIELANQNLHTSNDELGALNEELSTLNEELAAVNEELFASNEELATTNEELTETQASLQRALLDLEENAEHQARLAAIVESSDDIIISKTLQGIITSWNGAAERMFGYSQEEAIGRHIGLITPPSRMQEEEYIIGQIREGKSVDHLETPRLTREQREIPMSLTVSPIVDGAGNVTGASTIARDISSRQAAEEAAKRYTKSLEIINFMIETISEELELNKILQKVTDATTELTGAKFGAFFYNNIDEQGESFLLYTLSGAPKEAFEKFGMPRNTEVFGPTFSGERIVRADDITKDPRYGKNEPHHGMPEGHLPVVSYLAVPVISRSGAVIGGLFFGHPEPGIFTSDHEALVSSIAAQAAIGIDNAKLFEEVKELNEKKDEFIGLASHELKTPLTSISGYLQILNNMANDDQSKKFVARTLHQVTKLTSLVNDLLDVSKIEAGKLQLSIDLFNMREVIEETIELIQHINDKYDIALETGIENCPVMADSQRIGQVLINLLTNAIKYSPGANKIIVSLSREKKNVIVGVRDFGIGIPAGKQSQVFSRFYRVEDENRNISGLGIGLYICNEIIMRHGGRIWVESQVGKGSVFYFSLPVNE